MLAQKLETALVEGDKVGRTTAAGWKNYTKALNAINFVKNDGTSGVHNSDYAQAVLRQAQRDMIVVLKGLERKW